MIATFVLCVQLEWLPYTYPENFSVYSPITTYTKVGFVYAFAHPVELLSYRRDFVTQHSPHISSHLCFVFVGSPSWDIILMNVDLWHIIHTHSSRSWVHFFCSHSWAAILLAWISIYIMLLCRGFSICINSILLTWISMHIKTVLSSFSYMQKAHVGFLPESGSLIYLSITLLFVLKSLSSMAKHALVETITNIKVNMYPRLRISITSQ